MTLTLDNIADYPTPLSKDIIGLFFTDENNITPTPEHSDQIIYFSGESSKFLWNLEMKSGIEANSKYYKSISTYNSNEKTASDIKKYLYSLGIPFDSWVFIIEQPHIAFMVTWKMVIKYSFSLFRDDQIIWDRSLKLRLEYHHDGLFTFAKNPIYNIKNT